MAKLAASELSVNSLDYAGLRRGHVIELQAQIDGECLRLSVCVPGRGLGAGCVPASA